MAAEGEGRTNEVRNRGVLRNQKKTQNGSVKKYATQKQTQNGPNSLTGLK
jgi:hypothetical protein